MTTSKETHVKILLRSSDITIFFFDDVTDEKCIKAPIFSRRKGIFKPPFVSRHVLIQSQNFDFYLYGD